MGCEKTSPRRFKGPALNVNTVTHTHTHTRCTLDELHTCTPTHTHTLDKKERKKERVKSFVI